MGLEFLASLVSSLCRYDDNLDKFSSFPKNAELKQLQQEVQHIYKTSHVITFKKLPIAVPNDADGCHFCLLPTILVSSLSHDKHHLTSLCTDRKIQQLHKHLKKSEKRLHFITASTYCHTQKKETAEKLSQKPS